MANQEHLDILMQGVAAWNQWREEHPGIEPDLSSAHLLDADLSLVNLYNADLTRADLRHADLTGANLKGADLTGANLYDARLRSASLTGANLYNACLMDANLSNADLSGVNLDDAIVENTSFGNVDLSVAIGLETVEHYGPSTIGIDTIYNSHGNIPEAFLKRAGVQESFLTNMHALVESMRPIDFYSCFISYSSKDQAFAERLYADLQSKGVRCWYAPEDMKTGDEIRSRIDEAIRIHDKLLLVLSAHSVESTWVKRGTTGGRRRLP